MAAYAAVYLFVETAVPITLPLFAEMLAPGLLSAPPVIVVVLVCLNYADGYRATRLVADYSTIM